MKKIKAILTIFLVAIVLFLAPKDTKAYNSAPAFKCFYETKTESSNSKKNTIKNIKLIYVGGEIEAAKIEYSKSSTNPTQKAQNNVKKWLGNDIYNQLNNQTSCVSSFNKSGKTYKLTKSENLGTVTDKDCTYKRKDKKEKSDLKVHFYRTKYWKSYLKIAGEKKIMTSFWWSKNGFLYDGLAQQNEKTSPSGKIKYKGAYDSIHNYIENYSSKPESCPPKIFYNPYNKKWYAATDTILDSQIQESTNYLEGDDESYLVFKLNKEKKCEEDLNDLKTKLSIAKTTVGTLEQAVKSNDTWDEQAANTHITQFETLANQMKTVNDYMSGCEDKSDYKNLKDDMEIISNKISEIRAKLKEKINTSSIDEDKKADFLKKIDDIYKKLTKLGSMSLSMYNNEQGCGTIFGDPTDKKSVAYLIQTLLNYIKVLAPILVVILSSMDFIKVIWTSDDESMKKAQQKLGKRLVAAVLLFLLPTLIGLMFNLINDSIIDPTCKIK